MPDTRFSLSSQGKASSGSHGALTPLYRAMRRKRLCVALSVSQTSTPLRYYLDGRTSVELVTNPDALTNAELEAPLSPELEAEIDAALDRARDLDIGPVALHVEHLAAPNLLLITLSNGRRLALPVEDLQDIHNATPEQLRDPEILGPGTAIHFENLGEGIYIPAVLQGIYGDDRWMRRLDARTAQAA